MNIKKLNNQVALLTKITEALLKEAPKEQYSDSFLKLSKMSTDFRLPTFQQMYDDAKKAKNAAQLGTTSRGYFGLMKKIEEQILLVFNDSKRFNKDFYEELFRQFLKIGDLQLQNVKLEPVDPTFDSDDPEKSKIYGLGVKYPTTAQQMGRRAAYKDKDGNVVPAIDREQAQKNYEKVKELHISRIGIDKKMSPEDEISLDESLRDYAGPEAAETYIYHAERKSKEIVEGIAKDLNDLDPASSEIESAVNDVEEILSQDELVELEKYLEDIEKDKARGMHIPHPDFDPTDPKSPGYEETMNAEFVDMTKLKTLTEPQRLAIRAAEIRKRGIENLKRKEAYRNRTPEQIVADQVKRAKEKEEKEKRILQLIEDRKDITPDKIMKAIQDEYGMDPSAMSKKLTFNKIGLISLAMEKATTKSDKDILRKSISTLRQRLQKDFAKTKFLQHSTEELADLTQFLIKVYTTVMENIIEYERNLSSEEPSEDESKKSFEDSLDLDSDISDEEALAFIDSLKIKEDEDEDKMTDAINSYYFQQDIAGELAVEVAKMDEMDQEERFDLRAKISAFMEEKKKAEELSALLEGFTGLRHLATSSTYDFYATKVWSRAEKEIKAAIKTYCSANGIPEKVIFSKSLIDKITFFAMGRTYFGELEGHPAADRSPDQIKQFAYDLIGDPMMGSGKGANIPKQAAKTKGYEDYNMTFAEGEALAKDCVSEEGIIGKVINRIFKPEYAETGLPDQVKKFYESKGASYLFSNVYEGMLYGSYYRRNNYAVEIPKVHKEDWMKRVKSLYEDINKKNNNKLENELTKLIKE